MPPQLLAKVQKLRSLLENSRRLADRLLTEAGLAEAARQRLRRDHKPEDPAVQHAEAEYTMARQRLTEARAVVRGDQNSLVEALGQWLQGFPPGDLAEAGELSADLPIVLLPVKLEARYTPFGAPHNLLVRIYPDEIAADTHEPALTAAEQSAGRSYWSAAWDPEAEPEAWRALVRRYPSPRAAWIVRATTPTNLHDRPHGEPNIPETPERPATWTRAAEARLLPDRWLVIAYRQGKEVRRVLSNPILEPLALSPDPCEEDQARLLDISGDGLTIDREMAWMVQFDKAVEAGMGVIFDNLQQQDREEGFDRLIAIGVKASLPPEDATRRLADLLSSHHYTRGLAFVPQGMPTNNMAESPSGFPPEDPGGSSIYRLEREGLAITEDCDGYLFLQALGLNKFLAKELRHLDGADGLEQQAARAMNEALWPATWGYFLEQMLRPGLDQAAIDATRRYYVDYVRGRGPFPAFRIGGTPYGLLPVSSLRHWKPDAEATGPEARLPKVLQILRDFWIKGAERVPRIGRTENDPDLDLLEALAMEASAREVRIRGAWGDDFIDNMLSFYGSAIFGPHEYCENWVKQRIAIVIRIKTLLNEMDWPESLRNQIPPRLARMAFASKAYRFGYKKTGNVFIEPLVTEELLSEKDPLPGFFKEKRYYKNYINWLRQASLNDLREDAKKSIQPIEGKGLPLLYLMLRSALLMEFRRAALDLLIGQGRAKEEDRTEPELIGIPVGKELREHSSEWDRFDQPARLGPLPQRPYPQPTIMAYLSKKGAPEAQLIDNYRLKLMQLETLPTAELERLFTETLDTCSHRFDAWATSLTTNRLAKMRTNNSFGCHLGAYGWLEEVRPTPEEYLKEYQLPDGRKAYIQVFGGGHIQAPSLTHAAAAAVLRSGYLSRSMQAGNPFAIDLSSARVREARWLLEGIRQGQNLGALLGYSFERALHESKREKFIAPLRAKYPLVANKGNPGEAERIAEAGTYETIAARNVVDGLSLWRREREEIDPFKDLKDISGKPLGDEDRKALATELERLERAIDGVTDLLTAESIYQAVRGNTAAAGASLDAMAQGVRPPEPEVAHSLRGGIPLTHRVAVILGDEALTPAGWTKTPSPRAAAQPYLDGWVGTLLGNPSQVACRVTYPAPTKNDPQAHEEILVKMSELKLRPLDLISMVSEPASEGGASELALRVGEVALKKIFKQTKVTDLDFNDLRIKYLETESGFHSFAKILEVARLLRTVLGGSRPLTPRDLLPPEQASEASRASWEVDELITAAFNAAEALRKARNDLAKVVDWLESSEGTLDKFPFGGMRVSLRNVAAFGLPGAFPRSVLGKDSEKAATLLDQARSVKLELERRLNQIEKITSGHNTATARPETNIQWATEILQTVFGPDFVVMTRFLPARGAELELALKEGSALLDGDMRAPRKWFQQAARVRGPLGRVRRLSLYTTALGTSTWELEVAQLPYSAGAKWVALPLQGEPPPRGRFSLVLHRTSQHTPAKLWGGLFLDEWSELIPPTTAQTGLAFHYNAPMAEAPQALLLAVPPAPAKTWNPVSLVAIVNETLDLAKARTVDTESLADLGQILPAILLASNIEATIGADLENIRIGEQII